VEQDGVPGMSADEVRRISDRSIEDAIDGGVASV
jgi:hypothetical protein